MSIIKTELGLMRILDCKKWLPLQFQHWNLAVYPIVLQTIRHTWSIKTFSSMVEPRIILIAMQNTQQSTVFNTEKFWHCLLRNLKSIRTRTKMLISKRESSLRLIHHTRNFNRFTRTMVLWWYDVPTENGSIQKTRSDHGGGRHQIKRHDQFYLRLG